MEAIEYTIVSTAPAAKGFYQATYLHCLFQHLNYIGRYVIYITDPLKIYQNLNHQVNL